MQLRLEIVRAQPPLPLILEFTTEICGFEPRNSRYDVLYRDVAPKPCYGKGKG